MNINVLITTLTVAVPAMTALIAIIVTSALARRREHEADWRKLKFGQYQELILAMSGIVHERTTQENQKRYSDAANSMNIVASSQVLIALRAYQKETSYLNQDRDDKLERDLFANLIEAMRAEIFPGKVI